MNEHAELGVAVPRGALVGKYGRKRSRRQQRQRACQGGDFEEGPSAGGELEFILCEIFVKSTCHVASPCFFHEYLAKGAVK